MDLSGLPFFWMSTPKITKVEKITTDKLADETMNVIIEMLDIIVNQTKQGNPDDSMLLFDAVM